MCGKWGTRLWGQSNVELLAEDKVYDGGSSKRRVLVTGAGVVSYMRRLLRSSARDASPKSQFSSQALVTRLCSPARL